MRALALLMILAASGVRADTDFGALDASERAAMGREIRALLLEEPEIVGNALNPPGPVAEAMRENVDADLTVLQALAPQLLGDADIALIVGEDCATCDAAQQEIAAISKASGASFTIHMKSDPAATKLAQQLDVDDLPFYVLPDMILRGHMPAIVLEKYLNRP